jgi:hypothetical protein
MAHASLSLEGKIVSDLHLIDCSQRQFGEIAQAMGVPVSVSLINLCLGGKREFTEWTGEQLRSLLDELLSLRAYFVDIPINWSSFDKVATLLVRRRAEDAIVFVDAAAKG